MSLKDAISNRRLRESLKQQFKPVSDEELKNHEKETIQRLQCSSFIVWLLELRDRLKERTKTVWPNILIANGIKDLQTNDESVVCGILYKDMKLKPTVLDQYLKDLDVQVPTTTFLSDSDRLYLEDETVRIPLKPICNGIMSPNLLVTGMVIACRGKRISSGEFEVNDWMAPGVIQPAAPLIKLEEPRYVAFIHEMKLGCPGTNHEAILNGVKSYLLGNTGNPNSNARYITRLVVIGDTLYDDENKVATSSNTISVKTQNNPTVPIRALDETDAFFASISSSLPIDVMPGPCDPTNGSLPQQPLHKALFPKCRDIGTFRSVPNPYSFEVDGIRFLGLSRQSIEDILRFSDLESPIDALTLIADCQCLCPTAPDTLPCYPFINEDPFCIPSTPELAPHIIFSAGHASFECRRWYKNKWESANSHSSWTISDSPILITIPRFNAWKELILIDLTTLKCSIQRFSGTQ